MSHHCGLCSETFTRSDNLNRHLNRVHGISEEEEEGNTKTKKVSKDEDDDTVEEDTIDEEDEDSEEDNGDDDKDEDKKEEEEDGDKDEEEEGDDYVEHAIKDVFDEHEEAIQDHVLDPDNLDEFSKNKTIVDFLRDKLISKFADDFHTLVSWNSLDVTQKWARQARKRMAEDDIDAVTAMKRVLYHDQIIKEWIIEELDDMETEDEDETDN